MKNRKLSLAKVSLVCMIMLGCVAVSAPNAKAGVPPPYKWIPPYTGGDAAGWVSWSSSGVHTDNIYIFPNFDLTTGKGKAYISVSGGGSGAGYADYSGCAQVGMKLYKVISGAMTVYYDWTIYATAYVRSEPHSKAIAQFIAHGNVYDVTTHSWLLSNDVIVTIFSKTSENGNLWGGWTVSQSITVSFTVYGVAGHTYELYTHMQGRAYAYSSAAGYSASAYFDYGQGQCYAKCTRIQAVMTY